MINSVTIAVSLTALIIIVWLITRLNRINKSINEKNKQFEELKLSFRGSAASSENQVHIGNQINSKSDNLHRLLIDSAFDGISYYDNEGNLKYANPAFYSMIGMDSSSYNSISPSEIIHPDDHNYLIEKAGALSERGFYETQLRMRHLDAII